MSNFQTNSFQLHNDVFSSESFVSLSDAAFRCYVFIVRKTRGWHKTHDKISLSQFMGMRKTGKRATQNALDELVNAGLVLRTSERGFPNSYCLNETSAENCTGSGAENCTTLSVSSAENCTGVVQKIAPTKDTNKNQLNTLLKDNVKAKSAKNEKTLAEYIEQCKQAGVEALQDGSEAHTVADGLGLSDDMLATAWYEFKERYIKSDKKYANWVKAFSNSIRQNWYKIWYFHDNAVFWTNEGKGLCKLHLGYMPDNLNV
jgi:phage replication O-like protein O